MKKFICGFCSLVIMVMCLSGCGKAAENDVTDDTSVSEQVTEDNSINIFNDENSITVVSGNLSYSIPSSVQDQYDERKKDVGFTQLVTQEYDILSLGKIVIYQANIFYSEEAYTSINDLGNVYIKMATNRVDMKIFDNDEYSSFSTFNGVGVDSGVDLYMCTDDDNAKEVESNGGQIDKGEKRIIVIMKGLSIYLIRFECELGEYNKQVVDTFLDSIEFVSLEDY